MDKIVYVQANEDIAKMFQERFLSNEIEMIIARTGEEALDIIRKEKVLLLLIDINIPDMRLRKLVDCIRAISPQVILNACIDVLDPLMITKLSNRHSIHKIYAAPWNVEEIIEEVKESLEIAHINENLNVREEKLTSDKAELEHTLESLKETLKKQQNSYTKLSELIDCFVSAVTSNTYSDKDFIKKCDFSKDIYLTMLRMQTTGTFDIDRFEEDVRKDLERIKEVAPGFEVLDISSCLFGGQTKVFVQNIRFSIYLLARLYAEFCDEFTMSVTSYYNTTQEAEFCTTITLGSEMKMDLATFREYHDFVTGIIGDKAKEYRDKIDENVVTCYSQFIVPEEG